MTTGGDNYVSVQYLHEDQQPYKRAPDSFNEVLGPDCDLMDKVGTKIQQALQCLSGDLDYDNRAEAKDVLKKILSELGRE